MFQYYPKYSGFAIFLVFELGSINYKQPVSHKA